MKRYERNIYKWHLSGLGGFEHPCLVFTEIEFWRSAINRGTITIHVREFSNGKNLPNAESRKKVQALCEVLQGFVAKDLAFSVTANILDDHEVTIDFELRNGVAFLETAIDLCAQAFKAMGFQAVAPNPPKLEVKHFIVFRDDDKERVITKDQWLSELAAESLKKYSIA